VVRSAESNRLPRHPRRATAKTVRLSQLSGKCVIDRLIDYHYATIKA
jgi:hypothetical protein